MIKRQIAGFIFQWILSTFGMWVCINLFGTITGQATWQLYVLAGLVFSIVNSIVRPLATIFSLPLIVFTLGIFTIFVNTAMIGLTIWLLPSVSMDFWGAVLSSLVMTLINGVVNFWVTPYNS